MYNTANSGLPLDYVWALAIDAQGNKWMGAAGNIWQDGRRVWLAAGLVKFDGEHWTVYNTANSDLPNNNVYAVALDAQESKWVGTWRGGVAKFDGQTWEVYDTENSALPSNYVWSLAIDAQGNKWIGTWLGGLGVYREVPWGYVAVDQMTSTEFMTQFKAGIAGENTGEFVPLTDPGTMGLFEGLVEALFDLDLLTAEGELSNLRSLGLSYNLVQLTDVVSGGPIYGFMEQATPGDPSYRGWGAVLLRPRSVGYTVYQAPHVQADLYTEDITLQAFMTNDQAPRSRQNTRCP